MVERGLRVAKKPPQPKMCRRGRTGTPRREGRPTRAASTRTTRARGPASSTPAKGSRPGKCPRKLAAPSTRPRPAGRRAREVLRAPVAARAMVRAAVEMTRTYVPRRHAGSAPLTDEGRGVALPPPLGPGVWTASVFGDKRVESQPGRFSRIRDLRAAVGHPQRSARRDGAAHVCTTVSTSPTRGLHW